MNDGFVKLSRKLLKWEWADDPNMVALWIYILLRANWEDTEWHGMDIPRGSFITSIPSLSEATGISPRTIRTCLERLENTQELTRKVTNRNTLISVKKWEEFQCVEEKPTCEPTCNRHATDMQPTTDKKNKKNKNKEKIYKKESPKEITYDASANGDVDYSDLEEFLEERKDDTSAKA